MSVALSYTFWRRKASAEYNRNVKALVGEVDFTYHVISTASPSDDSLETLVSKKGKKD